MSGTEVGYGVPGGSERGGVHGGAGAQGGGPHTDQLGTGILRRGWGGPGADTKHHRAHALGRAEQAGVCVCVCVPRVSVPGIA
eukprot:3535020-Rhodomonas_salina.1